MEAVANTKEVSLIPNLRFKAFEDEWKIHSLEEIAEFKSGRTPSKDNRAYWNGTIPWISAVSMEGKYYSHSDRALTPLGLTKGSPLAPKGSLLLLVRGGMLYSKIPIGIAGQDVAFNQDVKALFVNEKFNADFIYQWFLAHENKLLNRVVGTGVGAGKLDTDELKKMKLHLPALPEQEKIVAFLTAVDEKIEQLIRKKTLLDQYKKGLRQKLFQTPLLGGDKRVGQIRFKPEGANYYPDWKGKKLGEIASRIAVRNKSNRVSEVLTISATRGVVSQQDYFVKDIANQDNLAGYYLVAKDDFVYNPRISANAPVGPIKRNKVGEGIVSPLYRVFRFSVENLEYMECFFSTNGWHQYVTRVANSEARNDRMNLSHSDFFNMTIPYPCAEERKKIVNCLSSLDHKVEIVNHQITLTQTFKRGLLQGMFV